MIRSHSVTSGTNYVKLKWTHPRFRPERFQLKYVCTMKSTCAPSQDTNHSIMTKTQNLTSRTTLFTIYDLHPSSICILTLLAIYNPASIDKGITLTGTTLDGASKICSGLLSFIIIFVNVYSPFTYILKWGKQALGAINLPKLNLSFLPNVGNEERAWPCTLYKYM